MDYMSQASNQDGQRGEIVVAYTYGQENVVQVKRLLKNSEWCKEQI